MVKCTIAERENFINSKVVLRICKPLNMFALLKSKMELYTTFIASIQMVYFRNRDELRTF